MMADPIARAGDGPEYYSKSLSKLRGEIDVRKRCLPTSTSRQRRFTKTEDTTFGAFLQVAYQNKQKRRGRSPDTMYFLLLTANEGDEIFRSKLLRQQALWLT